MPSLARITIFPFKSLPGVEVAHASFTAGGGLRHDRAYALFDAGGNLINGKRTDAVHRLPVAFALRGDDITVTVGTGADATSHVLRDGMHDRSAVAAVEERFSAHFGMPVRLLHDAQYGFPDDADSPGPTVVARASLQSVAGWFASLPVDEVRRRFRANLELDDCPPFWEDRLYGAPGNVVRFRIGEVELLGINPCLRCVVPSRDSRNGGVMPGFQRRFVEQRAATLPAWANRTRFDVYYRLSVNTCIAPGQGGKSIRAGDEVTIVG